MFPFSLGPLNGWSSVIPEHLVGVRMMIWIKQFSLRGNSSWSASLSRLLDDGWGLVPPSSVEIEKNRGGGGLVVEIKMNGVTGMDEGLPLLAKSMGSGVRKSG